MTLVHCLTGRWLGLLSAILILVALVTCSAEPPVNEPTATVVQPAPTTPAAPTAAPEPTATAMPATPTAVPTAPTATATATPPTPAATETTAVPTAAPTSAPTSPANEELRAASEKVFALVEELIEELGHREAGTAEELEAAKRIKERLAAMGYSAEMQVFAFEHFDIEHYIRTQGQNAQVIVESPIKEQSPGLLLTTTPKGGKHSGSLVVVGAGESEDFQKEAIAGKVVLIQPGDIALNEAETLPSLLEKVNGASEAGAIAAVISGKIIGMEQYRPLFGALSSIPALILPQATIGEQLHTMSQAGEVTLAVNIDTKQLESRNVVAELKGDGDGLVIVGGHYDVVPQTQAGANDNTSGIALMLALAETLTGESLPFTIRFIAFGAEEIGLYGSSHYVASLSGEELARTKAMLNFDVVASGPLLAATGQKELVDIALKSGLRIGSEG